MIEVDEVLYVKMRTDIFYILKIKQKQTKCWNIYSLELNELCFNPIIVSVIDYKIKYIL